MSPVHVIVGTDTRAESMWADAFSGAIDLYRFDRNVDAFERLTAAQAPIDLVILTPAQGGPFNLTPDQFVARVLEGPLASTPMLANLHIIVVGAQLTHTHPRAVSTRTLDAAIRLVKFGELDEAPRAVAPAPQPSYVPRAQAQSLDIPSGSTFSDSVISRIWAAADVEPAPAVSAAPVHEAPPVRGGGPAVQNGPARLFATAGAQRSAAAMPPVGAAPATVVGGGPASALAEALSMELAGSATAHVPAPVAAEQERHHGLQASRPYVLPNGGGYRGPEMRRNQLPPASSHSAPTATRSPVPPAIASQIRTMVYPQDALAPADPVLSWSTGRDSAPAGADVTSPHRIAHRVVVPVPAAQMPVAPIAAPAQPTPPAAHAVQPSVVQSDPFVQRVVDDGGVSFG